MTKAIGDFVAESLPEIKGSTSICTVKSSELINKFSSYNKLLRVTAFVQRFKNNSLSSKSDLSLFLKLGDLTIDEINKV